VRLGNPQRGSFLWLARFNDLHYSIFLVGIDLALLEPLNDIPNMGLYAIAISIAGYLSLFYTALAQTFEPDTYKAVAQYDYRKLVKSWCLSFLFSLLSFWLLCILAKPVIAILTANRYTDAYHFARILSIGVISSYLMVAIEGIINAFGFTKICLTNKIISSVIAVFLYIYLINLYGFTELPGDGSLPHYWFLLQVVFHWYCSK